MIRRYPALTLRTSPGGRSRSRSGLTLAEILVAITVASVMTLSLSTILVATYRTFGTEMAQNDVNLRCRLLVAQIAADLQDAHQVVSASSSAYTLPPGPTYLGGSSIPAANKLLVLEVPSFNLSGLIPGSYDYIGYGWNKTTGRLVRTCIVTSGSFRQVTSGLVPGAGLDASSLNFLLHDSSSGSSSTPLDPFTTPAPTIDLPSVDQGTVDATISSTSWGQTRTCRIVSAVRLRNWRLSLN